MDSNVEFIEGVGFLKKEPVILGPNYFDLTLKTRVLVFIFDKEESSTELKMIKEAGRILAGRMALRIGLVTDHKLIRKYKA